MRLQIRTFAALAALTLLAAGCGRGGFLRFWMACQSHELALLADRLDRDAAHDMNRQRDLDRNAPLPAGIACPAR